ncbi:MAG: ribosome small subunit-dependent GTPase A [Anaerolineae bacterium]|nr:ribosome small subunit-dependent GTPase A [Anaerolineae bacterium]
MSDKQVDRYVKGMKKAERQQKLRSANKKMKRNQSSKRTRRKDWLPNSVDPDAIEDWDELEYEQEERIMPLDESERRRTVERMAFYSTADAPEAPEGAPEIEGTPGLVIEAGKGIYRVDLGDRVILCGLRGNLSVEESSFMNPVAVGDEVGVTEDGVGGGVIEAIAPRRSIVARPDSFYKHMRQILAANVDQLLIVAAWRNPQIWLEMIDRYLIFAQRNDLPAVICVNKADLIDDEAEFDATMAPYLEQGYTVIRTSVVNGEGVDTLREQLHERATVLTGMSGVGKSSLISVVQPGLELRTSDVSEFWGEGRHTTTQATWLKLADGGAVVDTPGIREFGLIGLEPDELAGFFPEIDAVASDCRFRNCQHVSEPGCAVQAAVEAGEIAESRYHNYKLIYQSLAK